MMKICRLMIFCLLPVLTACFSPPQRVEFSPLGDSLPAAIVGQQYHAVIRANGGGGGIYLTGNNLQVSVEPEYLGLYVEPLYQLNEHVWSYDTLAVKGKPLAQGKVKIHISGYTYATMYTRSMTIDRVYTLVIHE